MIPATGLAVAAFFALAAVGVVVAGYLAERRQRADSRQPRHAATDAMDNGYRLSPAACAQMSATAVIPRTQVQGSPPWPVQPTLTEGGRPWQPSTPGPARTATSAPATPPGKPPSGSARLTTPSTTPAPPPEPVPFTATVPPSPALDRARAVLGHLPEHVGDALGHHGPRRQAVDAAVESIYTRAMARQVAALAEAAK